MRRFDPNALLVGAAIAVVAIEAVTRSQARYGPECLIVAAALAGAWKARAGLRTVVVVALAIALPAVVAGIHLAHGINGDIDVESVYPTEGRQLLDGTYPHSEYPPGAVVLFAAEGWVRDVRSVNPFAMALAGGAVAWAIASVRSRSALWLAALVALWPANAFFWEFKFDALPTAFILTGIAVALRRRWGLAGCLLGVGAAVKWTPALGFLVFVAWLLAERRPRDAARLAVGFSVAFAAVVGPFLFWNPSAVWASVSRQAPRGITPEAIWYLPLHALGYAAKPGAVYDPASVPSWANGAAVAVQVVVVAGLVALVALRRPTLEGAAALAALAPAGFLVLNKVFSAQYLLTILAGVCLAAAFTRRPLLIASLGAVAATANVLVYPIGRFWEPASALLFAASIAACGLAVRLACARLQRVPSAVVA